MLRRILFSWEFIEHENTQFSDCGSRKMVFALFNYSSDTVCRVFALTF